MKRTSSKNLKTKSRSLLTSHSHQFHEEEDSRSQKFLNQRISSLRYVVIKWNDAETRGGPEWVTLEDLLEYSTKPPPLITTVGAVLFETEEFITVTDTLGIEETGAVHCLPKGMIISIRELHMGEEQNGMSTCRE